ncbi:hypothetical protein FHS91_003544 [Sphingobium xanthum]
MAGHAPNDDLIVKASLGARRIAAGGFDSRFTRDDYA